jgi:SET domain-containing protein
VVHARESTIDGRGLFASQAISVGAKILQYVGERMDKAESSRRCEAGNSYIFTLDDNTDIDGNVPENLARFANHGCSPNCEAVIEGEEIWVVALRDIAVGEEITYNYGYDLEEYREHPCRCGSRECVGYMVAEEFFSHVRLNNASREGVAADVSPL